MSSINVQSIKELRERTQAGMGDCKAALVEADGDMEKAVEIILKKGLAKTAKRAGAIAAEGEVAAWVSADLRQAVVVEVNIQTDFAARNEQFKAFVQRVVALAQTAPAGADLSAASYEAGKTVADAAGELTARLGEKIAVRRWEKLEVPAGKHGFIQSYVHLGGRIGVLLHVETSGDAVSSHAEVKNFADQTAMQIAAMNPVALSRDDVSKDTVQKQREIFEAQLKDDPKPKPQAMWPKIVDGKVDKWFSEVTLLEQPSVIVTDKKVGELGKAAAAAAGGDLKVVRYVRYQLGEGIEKKKDDFASDVTKMLT
ncbi:MAG: elongation factor Ts [Polyangiaceae bacterium]|nr:elongation factor Ts [Polyangiaceae bacterium]